MDPESAIAGEFYSSHESKATAPSGRLCSFSGGCTTKLSIYNLTDRCSIHNHSKILVQSRLRRPVRPSDR